MNQPDLKDGPQAPWLMQPAYAEHAGLQRLAAHRGSDHDVFFLSISLQRLVVEASRERGNAAMRQSIVRSKVFAQSGLTDLQCARDLGGTEGFDVKEPETS